jgi:fatty acid desaturase
MGTVIGEQREETSFKGRSTGVEWPTVGLGIVILLCFAAVTLTHDRMPAAATIALLGIVAGWWASFQHELLHGHPFASQRINDAIGGVVLGLWLPYRLYKRLHLRHHRDPLLTDPLEDPESFYVDEQRWRGTSRVGRAVLWADRTLAWRVAVNPLVSIPRLVIGQLRQLPRDRDARLDWGRHLPGMLLVGGWTFGVAGVPVWEYLLGAVWVATSLLRLRSFAEHRWTPEGTSRTAFVEGVFPFGLLFLFNNYHHAHHARPTVPWYQYPALARRLGSRAAASEGAGYYRGYREIVRLHLFRPFDIPVHPSTPSGSAMMNGRECQALPSEAVRR